jgi:hypothetical protein
VSLQGLVIHPENPYFIFYQGRFLLSWANNGHGVNPNTLATYGINHYEIQHRWFDGQAPMLEGQRFPPDGSIQFDESYFDDLRAELIRAREQGVAVTLVLYSGPAFEGDRTAGSRFGQNPWNACLGGPIDIGTCPYQESGGKSPGGLKAFLTLESYDYQRRLRDEYSEYRSDWPTARKIQYRQEEILDKLMAELGDLDNWAFNIMWEIDDQWGGDWQAARDWAQWFAGYIHTHHDPKRLVFTGETFPSDEIQSRFGTSFYAGAARTIDGSQHEGIVSWGGGAYPNLAGIGGDDNGKPKVIIGYDPWDENGRVSDHLCAGGSGNLDAEKVVDFIRAALLTEHGVHPSTPFHFAQCGGGKQQVLDYMKVLGDFLGTVDSWHNEPGDEIRDETLPTFENYATFDLGAMDRPDGEGRQGWPRWGGEPSPPTATATARPDATPSPTPQPTPSPAPRFTPSNPFIDVPSDFWAYSAIEALREGGFVVGCSQEPSRFCPKDPLARAEVAVFLLRGLEGGGFMPPQPSQARFADVALSDWSAKWVEGLWLEGLTRGCGTTPLRYCPSQLTTREEAAVFFLRVRHGKDYDPPPPQGLFSDAPIERWSADWLEAAWKANLLPACSAPNPLAICPEDPLDRAMAAFLLARALELIPAPACLDGQDNDSDGLVDYPADGDCLSPAGEDEGHRAASAFNPPYPRVGQLYLYHPGQGAQIWKDHDLVMIRYKYSQSAARIKAANPGGLLLAANDLIVSRKDKWPESWYLLCQPGPGCKDGKLDSYHPDFGLMNITPLSPILDHGYGPQRFHEFLARHLVEKTDWSVFDGMIFDYWARQVWSGASLASIDGDRTPEGEDEVNRQWELGNQALIANLRALMDKPILSNEGGQSYLNGNMFEFWSRHENKAWYLESIFDLQRNGVPPVLIYVNSEVKDFGSDWRVDFALAQIAGAFIGHDEGTAAHRFTFLHDEYEADLGYPLPSPQGEPFELRPGVWVRVFERGAVIANISGTPQEINAGDLPGGPYWRFRGGQDPLFNDGSTFQGVTLAGYDGIMLFRQPTTLVTPIVIDNAARNMTSLGQEPAAYQGSWEQIRWPERAERTNSAYGLGIFWGEEENLYAATGESGVAVYTPKLGLVGRYELYEWHPDVAGDGLGPACRAVKVVIHSAAGREELIINQTLGIGRWNSLGVYAFSQGTQGRVELHAPGGCITASDAIRWVWRGD